MVSSSLVLAFRQPFNASLVNNDPRTNHRAVSPRVSYVGLQAKTVGEDMADLEGNV